MTTKKLDAAMVLRRLGEIRKSIPFLKDAPPRRTGQGDGRMDGLQPQTLEEFEYAAVADGLESLSGDIREALERMQADLLAKSLEVYYAAEELAKDPANAHLIPHVEKMREAYLKDYGKPIPPKAKGS